jgi:hypothetical protein
MCRPKPAVGATDWVASRRESAHSWAARLTACTLLAGGLLAAPQAPAAEVIDFQEHVAPLLETHCLGCHSKNIAKGEMSFASRDQLFENGYVVPGDPEGSYLLELIAGVDGEPPEMPQEAAPLPAEAVAVIRNWIAAGADWPEDVTLEERSQADLSWWSLQPLADVEPPAATPTASGWADHPIDRFLVTSLAEKGLVPNPPADRRTLIRRASYDLTGLPPTPEEVAAFITDTDPQAYEKLIDRLLASPHYGERWGRHWLDVVRFGESNGYERNFLINDLWPFRDWVIESFNDDKPFDRFIREHLAGDVFGAADRDVMIGSAFLVSGPYDDVGNQDPVQAAQIRADTLDEIIRSTGEGFLGLTIGCARCHNHKFDPIKQADYYRMYATFAGIRHGSAAWATPGQQRDLAETLKPLETRKQTLGEELSRQREAILSRAREQLAAYQTEWPRPPVDRTGTEERFAPVTTRFVRLVCEAGDIDLESQDFQLDEFEIYTPGPNGRNVALASAGAVASGPSRKPEFYGPQSVNDGKFGARLIGNKEVTIELAKPTEIDRVVFSSARGEKTPDHNLFGFVAEYRIEVSNDGKQWKEVAHGRDRRPREQPLPGAKPPAGRQQPLSHLDHRLLAAATTAAEAEQRQTLTAELREVEAAISKVPALPRAWLGSRSAKDAAGPFHIFLGGSPQKRGDEVTPASLSFLAEVTDPYTLPADSPEAQRRQALADWIVAPGNPLTPRVLANRLWHYHFGTGIVATPNDFGAMGSAPSHPQLLDWLARQLVSGGWRLKRLHKLIMTSQAYRQSGQWREEPAAVDSDARLLWRFPPRRLSAEELRDTLLAVSGTLDATMGGPGFRLYQFEQDNVCSYTPLDEHGPETYRRAVYHQNARASVVDLMTEFDQADCTLSEPRRTSTTTPLQALTLLNHSFTLDIAEALAARVEAEAGPASTDRIHRLFALVYQRVPAAVESERLGGFAEEHGLRALCRAVLNSNELLYLD